MLRFDPVLHQYWLGDQRLPSVSEIIAPAVDLSGIPEHVLNNKRHIGTAVHLACQYLDEDGEVANVHESIEGYVDAWRLFKSQVATDFYAIEQRAHNGIFAGTPDRLCRNLGVIDIKTVAAMSPSTALQTAAYAKLTNCDKRTAVQLKADGTYRLHHYNDATDTTTFSALLNFYHWKKKHDTNN